MSKRVRVILILALALVAMAALAPGAGDGRAYPRLNIVLILTDDQSPSSVSKMPYLTSRTGWDAFTNAYINNATCCPSRATILTGLWSHHHGVEQTTGAPRFDDSSTLATWLDGAGYRTGLLGKYHLGNVHEDEPETYIPPGWDEWAGWHGITGREAYYDYTLNENGVLVPYGSAPEDYSTDVLADKAVDFIHDAAATGDPFFLYLAPRAPHNPWIPAPHHAGAYASEPVIDDPSYNEDTSDKPAWWRAAATKKKSNTDAARRKEWAALLAVDDAVRRVHHAVQDEHLVRNTVIIYMSDNGYAYGEHRHAGKKCAYDPCSRTPLLIKHRGGNKGHEWGQLVSNEDIAPTIADLARVPPGAPVDGDSFAPFLRTGQAPAGWPDEVLLRGYDKVDDPPGSGRPPAFWGIRVPGYKYVETVNTGEVELYDLAADPFELESAHGDAALTATQADLASRLLEMRTREPR